MFDLNLVYPIINIDKNCLLGQKRENLIQGFSYVVIINI